jgi:hypothetical protein
MKPSILDFHVDEEPTLRELVFKYYIAGVPDYSQALMHASDYCNKIQDRQAKTEEVET